MLMNLAYTEGRTRAEEDFGLRTAGDSFHRALPHGDMNLPVERLAKHLSGMPSETMKPKEERRFNLERDPRWGPQTTPHGSQAGGHDYSGLGFDGAAI